ncbi:unnamed protein product [Pedinophyceae sp. YPF-701]|nr:unnamed protein product [Pedinophyceae sp. YPF-701]
MAMAAGTVSIAEAAQKAQADPQPKVAAPPRRASRVRFISPLERARSRPQSPKHRIMSTEKTRKTKKGLLKKRATSTSAGGVRKGARAPSRRRPSHDSDGDYFENELLLEAH